MFDPNKVKGFLFDYGGTIDSNGIHWAEVIRLSYEALHIPVGREAFRQAYVYAERKLAQNRIVLPHHTFRQVLELKAGAQLQWLAENGHLPAGAPLPLYAAGIADACYADARTTIQATRPVLEKLSESYLLILVSNFYGNLTVVLEDFGLRGLFGAVIESAVVGFRKPDPAIFRLGMEQSGLSPGELAVVGDSYDKDIAPAASLGCQTIWLKRIAWEASAGEETADLVITDFAQLKDVFRLP
jgi:putative hydrolase of the HAD superfamily